MNPAKLDRLAGWIADGSRRISLVASTALILFAAVESFSMPPSAPAWACAMAATGHFSSYDGVSFANDRIDLDCQENKGWGCPGAEKAWLWRWVQTGNFGAWIMCGYGPFVDRTIFLNCGDSGSHMDAGVNLANFGPPGNQWCITHRVWNSYSQVIADNQSFYNY